LFTYVIELAVAVELTWCFGAPAFGALAKAVGPIPTTVTVLTVIVVKTTLRSDPRRDTWSPPR
jgi:hypothetical protein